MKRATAFDRLDSLPTWQKKGCRTEGKEKRNVVAAHLSDPLAERLTAAMQTVGLSASSLVRVGLLHVIREIESTGALNVPCRD